MSKKDIFTRVSQEGTTQIIYPSSFPHLSQGVEPWNTRAMCSTLDHMTTTSPAIWGQSRDVVSGEEMRAMLVEGGG
jgi:hypothetical protein